MTTVASEIELIRSNISSLIEARKKARMWFWRTSISSLTAAGLWILIYVFASKNAGVKESLAIIVGAILMWVLFFWTSLLIIKLNRITAEIKRLERKFISLATAASEDSDASA